MSKCHASTIFNAKKEQQFVPSFEGQFSVIDLSKFKAHRREYNIYPKYRIRKIGKIWLNNPCMKRNLPQISSDLFFIFSMEMNIKH